MGYQHIEVSNQDAIRTVTLARAGARNAQSQALLDELDQAMREAAGDYTVRVVIIGGEGDHFSAGHDLKEAQASRADFSVEQRWAYESLRYFDYCMRIWDFPKPVIARVQGACVSGGFMIANMCDLVVCSDDAFFSDPVCHTLAAAATEVLIHPWVMGLRRAKEMLFTGERVTAEQALQMGMVNRVVARAQLNEETMALARRVAAAPPFALKLVKKSLNRTLDAQGLRTALSAHFDVHQLSHMSDEFAHVKKKGLAQAIQRSKSGDSA